MHKNVFGVSIWMFLCVLSVNSHMEEGAVCFLKSANMTGTCVNQRRCRSILNDIKTKRYPQICSFSGRDPIICCTDCELVDDISNYLLDANGKYYMKSGVKAEDKCLEYTVNVDYPCLMKEGLSKRVSYNKTCFEYIKNVPYAAVGGTGALRREFPHMIVLYLKLEMGYWKGPLAASYLICECLKYAVSLNYPCPKQEGLVRQLEYLEKKCFIYEQLFTAAGVGGEDAQRRQFPHMALLGFGESIENAQWLCGGSVISDRFILTAAHCLSSKSVGTVKYAALGILKRTDPPETWQRYNVRRAIRHPEYKPPSKYNDIALLEMDKTIKFNKDVLPACLNTGGSNELYATATGWGTLGHRQSLADVLQVVQLEQFSVEECSAAYPPHRHLLNGYHHASQSCYGNKNNKVVDTCEGDSGGPLQITSKYGTCVYNIIGVTSYGRPCGFVGNTGMYTKVEYFVPWIESIVWP